MNTLIIVRPRSSEHSREYHVEGEQISKLPYAEFSRPLWGDPERRFTELGSKGKAIAEALMAQGQEEKIERITFHHDSVCVYRDPGASWGPLEWKVIVPAIKAALDDGNPTVMQYEDYRLQKRVHEPAFA